MNNPWGLTRQEAAAMQAVTEQGCYKRAADAMNISPKTIAHHLTHARRRMGIESRIAAILEFDRQQRSQA